MLCTFVYKTTFGFGDILKNEFIKFKKTFHMLKPMDYILVFLILFSAIYLLFYLTNYFGNINSTVVIVTVNNKEYGRYDLYKNQEIIVYDNGHYNKLIINEGIVTMIDADCDDLLCVYSKPIEKSYETIVCLPNRVVVELSSEEENELDEDELDGFAS